MSGGGSSRGSRGGAGGGGGGNDPCEKKYEAELKDWQHQNPGSQVVRSLPDASQVLLQPDPKDPTVQVFDMNGVKLGHLVKATLKECMKRYTYTGVFYRKGNVPWVRATRS